MKLDEVSHGAKVLTPGWIDPMPPEEGLHIEAPTETDRLEHSDCLSTAHDGVVLPAVLNGVEQIGEVTGGLGGGDLRYVIRLSDFGQNGARALNVATEEDLRRIALSLPGTEERPSYGGRPGFRVRGRGFVGIWKDNASVVLLAESLAEKQALLSAEPHKFFTTPHYGDSPRLLVRLAEVDVEELEELVIESWRQHAPADLLSALDPGADGRR